MVRQAPGCGWVGENRSLTSGFGTKFVTRVACMSDDGRIIGRRPPPSVLVTHLTLYFVGELGRNESCPCGVWRLARPPPGPFPGKLAAPSKLATALAANQYSLPWSICLPNSCLFHASPTNDQSTVITCKAKTYSFFFSPYGLSRGRITNYNYHLLG